MEVKCISENRFASGIFIGVLIYLGISIFIAIEMHTEFKKSNLSGYLSDDPLLLLAVASIPFTIIGLFAIILIYFREIVVFESEIRVSNKIYGNLKIFKFRELDGFEEIINRKEYSYLSKRKLNEEIRIIKNGKRVLMINRDHVKNYDELVSCIALKCLKSEVKID